MAKPQKCSKMYKNKTFLQIYHKAYTLQYQDQYSAVLNTMYMKNKYYFRKIFMSQLGQ